MGGSAKATFLTGEASGSIQGQWGTRDISQNEYSDVRTTDNSKEQRENYSHTTQLTQMYQQLNSYHLGTNRAVFFLLPRPHIIDDKETPLTFVNGPRRLEGIQEFFLVVMRPKEIKDICVEAYLETAHVGEVATYGNRSKTDTDTTQTLSLIVQSNENRPRTIKHKSGSISYPVRPGWEIDTSNNGGCKINIIKQEGLISCVVTEIDQKHLVLKGESETAFKEVWESGEPPDGGGPVNKPHKGPPETFDGVLNANATVFLRQGQQVQTGSASGLYITGRGVCCCQTLNDHDKHLLSESVVGEQIMPLLGLFLNSPPYNFFC